MKTIAATLFVLATGLGASTATIAEPFNDRGVNPITASQADGTTARPAVSTNATQPFKNRGPDYIVEAPAGSPSQEPAISLREQDQGWNS